MNIFKKIITTITLCAVLFQGQPVVALEVNTPIVPSVEQIAAPVVNVVTAPEVSQPSKPEVHKVEKPILGIVPSPELRPIEQPHVEEPANIPSPTIQQEHQTQQETSTPTAGTETTPLSDETGTTSDGNVGDTAISTGNATNTAAATTTANANLSDGESSGAQENGPSASVTNTGNGSGSTNTGSATIDNTSTTNQDNSATVANTVNQGTNTGLNSASENVGTSTIVTGDANTSATIVNMVNTNANNVMLSEFNIAEDHVGDYVLDYEANCVSGCGQTSQTAQNSGNASGSDNTAEAVVNTETNTFQNNDAVLDNNIVLASNSGSNAADKNTGGDNTIDTGDANVSATVVNFANNNIDGGVVYGTVNIYGDLEGDIIFPEEYYQSLVAANSGNGSDSTNTATANSSDTSTTLQDNSAAINNTITADAQTGANETDQNTGGTNTVTTGDSAVDVNTTTVANNNIDGNWFLVLINEAGNWIGNIIGGDGSNVAGSENMQFAVDDQGNVTVANNNNGSDSTNTASTESNTTTTTTQTNNATINNNLSLSANTGDNSASKNTGGDNTIITGDATIVANIVNFVNNNITGGGKLFVTVVNVFGSWTGDFITPWGKKEETVAQTPQSDQSSTQQTAVGGPTSDSSVSSASSASSNPSDSSDSSGSNLLAHSTPRAGGTRSLAASTTGQNSPAAVSEDTEETVPTLSDEPLVAAATSSKKTVTFNLAWLLFSIPGAALLLGIKKVVVSKKAVPSV